jgi:hypothetical protein
MPLSTELMRERMLRNRLGTLASGKTLQGGVAGLMDVAGQAALAESDAMGKIPEEEADLSAELIKDAFDTETGLLGGGDDSRTATMKNLAKAQEIMNNPNISESDKARLLRILGAGDIATNKETRNELYMLALDIVSKQEAIGGGSLYKDSESLQAAAKKLYEELVKGSPLLEIPEA